MGNQIEGGCGHSARTRSPVMSSMQDHFDRDRRYEDDMYRACIGSISPTRWRPTSRCAARDLHHPLLDAPRSRAREPARSRPRRASSSLSYRHVWGELKRWEAQLDRPAGASGPRASRRALSPFGAKLLWAERPRAGAARAAARRRCAASSSARSRSPSTTSAGVIPVLGQPRRGAAAARATGRRGIASCIWTSSSPAASTRWPR